MTMIIASWKRQGVRLQQQQKLSNANFNEDHCYLKNTTDNESYGSDNSDNMNNHSNTDINIDGNNDSNKDAKQQRQQQWCQTTTTATMMPNVNDTEN